MQQFWWLQQINWTCGYFFLCVPPAVLLIVTPIVYSSAIFPSTVEKNGHVLDRKHYWSFDLTMHLEPKYEDMYKNYSESPNSWKQGLHPIWRDLNVPSPSETSSNPSVISSKTVFSPSRESRDWSTYSGTTVSPTLRKPLSGVSCAFQPGKYQVLVSTDY